MTMTSFDGRRSFEPFGIIASDPPMPTGRIGTCVFAATYAGPSNKSSTTGPSWRVPSGNITSGSPASITSMHVRSASRSAAPRLHRERRPRTRRSAPSGLLFQIESLAM